MKNKLRNKKGITLIALVITIIVLLILAGVSITMISSQDGILKKATGAKDAQKSAQDKESSQMAAMENMMEYETIETVTDVSKLTTELPKMTKYVDNTSTVNKEAIIPRGFKVSSKAEEQKIDTGLVVMDKNGNEFVWVPVPDVIYTGTKAEETTKIKVAQGTDNKEYYTPMAKLQESSTTNYEGILYDLNKAKGSQVVMSSYGVGTTSYREPSLVTGRDSDTSALLDTIAGTDCDAKYYNLAGNYSDIKAFGKDMQEEYNNMVKSVAKYGGFYVGRYETGIKEGKAVSKNASITDNNTTTADASLTDTKMWYGLYNKQRTMAKDNGLDSVESSMIWGSQYDAMMIWMQKTGTIIGLGFDTTRKNTEKVTGNLPNDVINKVYDLYGCHNEWTLESYLMSHRVSCGGRYNFGSAPSFRVSYGLGDADDRVSSRLSLYIK